ncbi:MAG: HAMP domain-containing protein [Rhodocyclaceae bacterium]|nr:MAG: HAMP domain-containing protein [Rhodocyclaceae bacterium]
MKLRFDSLYLRLALVLAAALVAGFVTMGWMFQQHMEQDRGRGERRGMAGQIHLIENILVHYPALELPADTGLVLFRGPQPPDTESGLPPQAPPELAKRIADELGHPVALRHNQGAQTGLWISLAAEQPTWLFVPPPKPPNRPVMEPWTWGLLVSFAVVLVGGMALLWRVQVPLRKLERALDDTGPATVPQPLHLRGPGEVKRLAERFNRMRARLHRHEQDREVMLAGVAHDLRAPVTRLRLQLELENSARRDDMLRNLDSVEAIVDQFLLFARGGEGEARSEWELNAFVAEVAAPYESQGVHCQLIDDADIIAPIHPSSLRRALCNLIENGLEYGAAPVNIRVESHGGHIAICVADSGKGIAPEDRERALRPFSRLDDARGRQGHSGLGLAIAARIAEGHGGALTLSDAPEGGLLARLTLPRH